MGTMRAEMFYTVFQSCISLFIQTDLAQYEISLLVIGLLKNYSHIEGAYLSLLTDK